jgi:MbtH protein
MKQDGDAYLALVNDEGQYSLWNKSIPTPAGWVVEGVPMTREECLEFIERSWGDMRPKSVRGSMSVERAISVISQRKEKFFS